MFRQLDDQQKFLATLHRTDALFGDVADQLQPIGKAQFDQLESKVVRAAAILINELLDGIQPFTVDEKVTSSEFLS